MDKAPRAELERLRLLYRIRRQFDPTRDSKSVLRGILREAVRAMRATSGSIAMIDWERKELIIEVGVKIDRKAQRETILRVGEGVTGSVARTGKPLRVNDVDRSSDYVPIREGVRSEMAVPLRVDGQLIGVLNVDADRVDAFTKADEALLVEAADEAALVFHHARLEERLRQQSEKLETLYRVGHAIATIPTLEEALNRIAEEVREAMDAKVASIQLLDESGECLEIQAVAGASRGYKRRPALKVEDLLIGKVVTERAPLTVRDVRRTKGFHLGALARREGLCSLLSVPIEFQDRPIGVLNIYTARPAEFDEAQTRLLQALAGQSAVAIESARRTERAALADEQLRHVERLSTLGALAAEIAHEIRNPISVIQMLTDAMARDSRADDPRRRDAEVIKAKLAQINRIVEQVLDVARARDDVNFEPFDVHRAIDDALFLTERRMAKHGVEVRKRLARDLPPTWGDRFAIEQVIVNLALNAVQAMPEGGRLTVTTRLLESNSDSEPTRIAVRVRDSGGGIPKRDQERIFKPFFTTRENGVGIGLFVARKILSAHNGDLTVKSRKAEGATFELCIPVQKKS